MTVKYNDIHQELLTNKSHRIRIIPENGLTGKCRISSSVICSVVQTTYNQN